MEKITLTSLFDHNKGDLCHRLQGLILPNDVKQIQTVVEEYLNKIFDEKGEFRLSLTQSEDYILQAALSLLNSQQAMIGQLTAPRNTICAKMSMPHREEVHDKVSNNKVNSLYSAALSGSALGGLAGGVVGQALGGMAVQATNGTFCYLSAGAWGALAGSIAGTALVLYGANGLMKRISQPLQNNTSDPKSIDNTAVETQKLDVDEFCSVIHNICESIDGIINSFRVQINRVISQYENQPRPTLESEFSSLLETIQSLIGYKRAHSANEEKYNQKLDERIEELAEILDTYSIDVVDFDGTNDRYFTKVASTNTDGVKMVLPALIKNGEPVLRGKIFIKQ